MPQDSELVDALQPLLLTPQLLEKVWGGRRLERFGKVLSEPGANYGESWELADMGATSTSGAGGGAFRSVIASGSLAGTTLHDAITRLGDALIPRALLTPGGDFPLLIKLLDAREHLSVQVHPSPEYAAAHAGANLKTECWYILDADPGAELFIGMRPGMTRDEFASLARHGGPALVDAMVRRPAVPGELHNLPSGTIHALGAGVLVAEVQTPSDTTFRIYDWERTGRELHTEAAIAAATFDPGAIADASIPSEREAALVTTEFFELRELILRYREASVLIHPKSSTASRAPLVVMPMTGTVDIETDGGISTCVRAGQTVLVPTGLVANARVGCLEAGVDATVLIIEPRLGIA